MYFPTISTLAVAALTLSHLSVATPAGSSSSSSNGTASAQRVGWTGTIETRDAGLAGTVTVVDANTLKITNYALEDASAPALYWWGAADDNLAGGFRISNQQVRERAASNELTIPLDAGKTPADFVTVGLWCERFQANFGQAKLSEGGAASSGSSGSGSSGSAPSSAPKPGAGATHGASFGAVGALAAAAVMASWMA